MNSMLKTFSADEAGAVTVDWVVLTAAIAGLCLAIIGSLRSGVNSLDTEISSSLSDVTVVALGTLGAD